MMSSTYKQQTLLHMLLGMKLWRYWYLRVKESMPNCDDKDKRPYLASAEGGEKYFGEHLGKALSTFFCVS